MTNERGVMFRKDFAEHVKRAVEIVLGENPGLIRTQTNRLGRMHDFSLRIGKLDEDIAADASGDVVIYQGTTKGDETASSTTVTAYNRFGDLSDTQWCIIAFIDGGWEIIAAGCE